jgi:predicted Fe-Mo cluster-binding NifX family protein
MKIAFSTSGNDLSAEMDSSFGRARKFLIYDLNDNSVEIIDNDKNLNAAQGAGIQSAENVIRSGAKVLITGDCGPKAYHVLSSAGVKIFKTSALNVAAALDQYRSGKLSEAGTTGIKGY